MSDWKVIGARRNMQHAQPVQNISSTPINAYLSQGVFSNRRVGVYAGGRRLPALNSQPSPPKKVEPSIDFLNKDDFPSLSSSSSSNTITHTFRPIPDFKAAANKGIQHEQNNNNMIYNSMQQPEIPIPVIRRIRPLHPQTHRIDMSYDDPIEGGFSDDDDEIIRIKRKNHNESANKFQSVTRMRIIQAQNFESRNLEQEDLEKTNTPPYGPGPDDDF
jgi:hypothetical protein